MRVLLHVTNTAVAVPRDQVARRPHAEPHRFAVAAARVLYYRIILDRRELIYDRRQRLCHGPDTSRGARLGHDQDQRVPDDRRGGRLERVGGRERHGAREARRAAVRRQSVHDAGLARREARGLARYGIGARARGGFLAPRAAQRARRWAGLAFIGHAVARRVPRACRERVDAALDGTDDLERTLRDLEYYVISGADVPVETPRRRWWQRGRSASS